jgi:hypothetical protein
MYLQDNLFVYIHVSFMIHHFMLYGKKVEKKIYFKYTVTLKTYKSNTGRCNIV